MNYAQRLWTQAADGDAPRSAAGKHDARDWQEREEGRNANELAAQAIANTIGGRPLTDRELAVAASLIHYSFGAAGGAIYGAFPRDDPRWLAPRGAMFGTAGWLWAGEIPVPLLCLFPPPIARGGGKH